MIFQATQSMTKAEVLKTLDLSPSEAESLFREAKTPPEKEELTVAELTRLDVVIPRMVHVLVGRDWRRADGADREANAQNGAGSFDIFHRKTGQRQALATFGDLLRWSESEYGWKV